MSDDPTGVALIGQLLIIVVLTLLNAIYAAGEMAIVSVNKTEVEKKAEQGGHKDNRILREINHPTNFLSTIQVAVTLAGFLSSAIAATSLSTKLEGVLGNFPGSFELSMIIITIILAFLILIFGELFPKQIAVHRPYQVLRFTEPFINVTSKILKPFVWFMTVILHGLMKLTPIDFSQKKDKVSRSEMLSTIQKSRESGTINADEYQMLQGIIKFSDKTVREVMVPRTDAFMIDINDPLDENIDAILAQPYSRIPVYGGDKDTIIGIVHIKNLLKQARVSGFENVNLNKIMIEPLFVPESTSIDSLLLKMQSTQTQIAMIMDDYGGVVGLATIEDILEEIVGEIDDEYDQTTTNYHRLSSTKYSVVGKFSIEDFNELFDENIDEEQEDADTIAGYLIMNLNEIPDEKHPKSITLKSGVKLTSGEVDGARIQNVIVKIPKNKVKIVTTNMFEKKY